MKMSAPSTSYTGGGRVSGEINASNGVVWTIGTDYMKNNRDARRYSGPPTGGTPTNRSPSSGPMSISHRPACLPK
jgi:hypothetical protein